MKNITISLPEATWERLRLVAAERKLSLNAYVRGLLEADVLEDSARWHELFLRQASELKPTDSDWVWNREEIYEEAI